MILKTRFSHSCIENIWIICGWALFIYIMKNTAEILILESKLLLAYPITGFGSFFKHIETSGLYYPGPGP